MAQEIFKRNKFGFCKYGDTCRSLHINVYVTQTLVKSSTVIKDILINASSTENMDVANSEIIVNISMNYLRNF